MLHPSAEYAYVDEYGQPIDPSNSYNDHYYVDNQEQIPSQMVHETSSYDNQPVQIQTIAAPTQDYQTILNNGSQPL